MYGRPAERYDYPGGQVGEVLVSARAARRGAHVLPGELREARPFVVDEILDLVAGAGLEDHRLDALEGEFGAQGSAAGARTDDDHDAGVVQVERCCHDRSPTAM